MAANLFNQNWGTMPGAQRRVQPSKTPSMGNWGAGAWQGFAPTIGNQGGAASPWEGGDGGYRDPYMFYAPGTPRGGPGGVYAAELGTRWPTTGNQGGGAQPGGGGYPTPGGPGGGWGGGAPTPQQPGGGGGGQMPGGGPPPLNVNTSIQPQPVYPNQFTNQMQSMARALATPTMPNLRLGRSQEGVSYQSPATQYGMGLDAARQTSQGAMGASQIGLQHSLANAQSIMADQQAREQEARQWASLGQGNWQNNVANQFGQQQNLLGLLGGMGQWWM